MNVSALQMSERSKPCCGGSGRANNKEAANNNFHFLKGNAISLSDCRSPNRISRQSREKIEIQGRNIIGRIAGM
jgi:hypothetical protein